MNQYDVISWVDPDQGDKRFEGRVRDVQDAVVEVEGCDGRGPVRFISLHRVHSVEIIRSAGCGHGSWACDV